MIKQSKFFITAILMTVFTSGCVSTRDAIPIAMHNDNDYAAECNVLKNEYNSNTEIAAAKIEKNNDGDAHDALVGFLIWPGLADFKNADGTEGNALLDRNEVIINIARGKGCNVNSWKSQPERYTLNNWKGQPKSGIGLLLKSSHLVNS